VSLLEAILVVAAGFGAGAINTVVGSGTLVTFPTLVAVGLPPVVANVSNTVGLVPGSVSGAWAYRRELGGQAPRLLRLGVATFSGAVAGAILLLVLPAAAFAAIVPVLILVACVLVVIQPWLVRWLGERPRRDHGGPLLWSLIFVTGAYGGYFGAGQGVLLIAVLGLGLSETIQRINAAKNVLAGLANLVAGAIFAVVAEVDWAAVGLIAIGAAAGGIVGGGVARRLPAAALRAVVVAIGLVAVVTLR
jgi:uncharacterized protein